MTQTESHTSTLAAEIKSCLAKAVAWEGVRNAKDRAIGELTARQVRLASEGRDVLAEIRKLRQEIKDGDDAARRSRERIVQCMAELRTEAEASTKVPLEQYLSLKIKTRCALIEFVELFKRMRTLTIECPSDISAFNALAAEIEGAKIQTPRFPRIEACSFTLPDWRWSQIRSGNIDGALSDLISDLA